MILENDCLRLALDGSGRIISFADKRSGVNIIAEPVRDPFMLTLVSDDCKENIVWGGAQSDCKARIDPDACRAEFLFDRLAIDNGRADAVYADISVKFIVSLDGDHVDFTAEIDNRGDYMISDFEYPRVGKIKSLSKDSLPNDNLSADSSARILALLMANCSRSFRANKSTARSCTPRLKADSTGDADKTVSIH